jgi:predicted enzyme related to lactoylglutathione lyase
MSCIVTTFEINATDLDRAARFYGAILGKEIPIANVGGERGGLLSAEDDAPMGVIRCAPEYARPSDQGNNLYFRIEQDLDGVLASVERLGGRIVVPKMDAGDFGQFAWILDSEGNRIGLNQPKR